MTAYIILDISVKDTELYKEYMKMGPPTVSLYGGKYIVRGGQVETAEGDWNPRRLVMLEFESIDMARAWINSPEYAPARNLRHQAARTQAVIVEGIA